MTGEQFSLPDGKTLHLWQSNGVTWACMGYDHGPMCRRCQEVDGILGSLLENVLDGLMTCFQDPDTAEFNFKMTELGNQRVEQMIKNADDEDGA